MSNSICLWNCPDSGLSRKKKFKADSTNAFKELKETKLKGLKLYISFTSHKILNINNGMEIIKRNQLNFYSWKI